MTEGTVLRILYTLEALYPSVLARTRSQLRWRLMPSGAAFVHMCDVLDTLARLDVSPAPVRYMTCMYVCTRTSILYIYMYI